MRHVKIATSASTRSDIEQRLTGKFYTPTVIAEKLVATTLAYRIQPNTIGDPFCGDGRLVLAWLAAAEREGYRGLRCIRRIVLWDYDGAAVRVARERVDSLVTAMGLKKCKVDARDGDTFGRAALEPSSMDVILTNPPWELLKPDTRDGVGRVQARYTKSLRGFAGRVAALFPESLSAQGKAMTGYGVNLARAGALASMRLLSPGGVLGIVLPASIFADQASAPFRGAIFGRTRADSVDWYPAESKAFQGVDQPFVTCVAQVGEATSAFRLDRHAADLSVCETREVTLSAPSAPVSFSVGGEQVAIVDRLLRTNPRLRWLEEDPRFGLWLGRELDETRIAEAFSRNPGSGIQFLKGRHVFPWEVRWNEGQWIDPGRRSIPATVTKERLAWRDVSRPTQRRRMHVALVPRGAVTGNSLGVGYFRHDRRGRLRVLLAVLNSFAFEIQVRALLATAHVSQGVLRQCAIPEAAFVDSGVTKAIGKAADERLKSGLESPHVEVAVARAYGLKRDTFETVLGGFPKVTGPEREVLLDRVLWK